MLEARAAAIEEVANALEKARWDFEGGARLVGVDAFIGDARAPTEWSSARTCTAARRRRQR